MKATGLPTTIRRDDDGRFPRDRPGCGIGWLGPPLTDDQVSFLCRRWHLTRLEHIE